MSNLAATIQRLEEALTAAADFLSQLDARNALAWELHQQDLARAETITRETLAQLFGLIDRPEYAIRQADAWVVLARIFTSRGDYIRAVIDSSQALTVYKQYGVLSAFVGRAYRVSGMALIRLGDYSAALDAFMSQLEIYEKQGIVDDEGHGSAYNNIGIIYYELGDPDTAQRHFERAETFYIRAEDYAGVASEKNNLCLLELMRGNYEGALVHGHEALRLFQDAGHDHGRATVHGNFGQIYTRLGDYARAEDHLLQAIPLVQSASTEIANYLYLGRLYTRMARYDGAIAALTHARQWAESSGSQRQLGEVHRALAEVYEVLEDWKTALEHFRESQEIADAVRSGEHIHQLQRFEVVRLTQQAQAEAETQRRLREQERAHYERLSNMKDDFLNTASHDLKNPLTAISMSTYKLRSCGRVTHPEDVEQIARIESTIVKMRSLITNLLDLARLEMGGAINREPGDLVIILRGSVDDFRERARAKQIEIDVVTDAAACPLYLNVLQFRQLFDNLVSNAVKYTPLGGLVRIELHSGDQIVEVRVIDTGIGIPAEALPHIFDRFYRVEADDHADEEGTGLGLAIARSIVERHGGQISAASVLGRGSTFTVTLPRVANMSAVD